MNGKVFGDSNEVTSVNCAAACAFIMLALLVSISPSHLLFDEIFYIEGAKALQSGMSIGEMLKAPLPTAPGPLYPILHALLSPWTTLSVPAMRFVNLGILAATLIAIASLVQATGKNNSAARASMMLALPLTWVAGGLALTQMPALLMASLCCLILVRCVYGDHPKQPTVSIFVMFAMAGMFAGLAILGRQTYLPILCTFILLLFRKPLRSPALIGICVAGALVTPVFITWGGLIPKNQTHIGGSIYFINGVLGFAYLGIYLLCIAPSFFNIQIKSALSIIIFILILNAATDAFEFRPFEGVLFSRLDDNRAHKLAIICGGLLIASFLFTLQSFLRYLTERSQDEVFIVAAALTIILTGTTFCISHFSSLYVMAAFPFALIAMQPFFLPTRWAALRLIVGSTFGALAFMSNW